MKGDLLSTAILESMMRQYRRSEYMVLPTRKAEEPRKLQNTLHPSPIHHNNLIFRSFNRVKSIHSLFTTLHHSSPPLHLIYFFHFYSIHLKILGGWRVVKSERALFTSRNPSVYRGFRRKGEGWRVKKRLGFYTTHQKKTRCTNSTNTRGHIVSCLALALYCPVLEQYLAKAR